MRSALALVASTAFVLRALGLNILITTDDGFGSASVRELYKVLNSHGHNTFIVAAPTGHSKVDFQTGFTTEPKLTVDGDWGLVKAGEPSLGHDPHDDHIWYYNGSTVAQVIVALDYILPQFHKVSRPDLIISGPNINRVSLKFPYTTVGIMGPAYAALQRGVPAIAFWTEHHPVIPYSWIQNRTNTDFVDPWTATARMAASLVESFIERAAGGPVLPQGVGVAVDLPASSDNCKNPSFVLIRGSQDVPVGNVQFDATMGLFTTGLPEPVYTNEDFDVGFVGIKVPRGETPECVARVVMFAVNFDAATDERCLNAPPVPLVQPPPVVPNVSATGNLTIPTATPTTPVSPPPATVTAMAAGMTIPSLLLLASLVLAL